MGYFILATGCFALLAAMIGWMPLAAFFLILFAMALFSAV